MTDEPNYNEPLALPCGWTCPDGWTRIVCAGCNHIFGEKRPVEKGDPEGSPETCEFCVGAQQPLAHVRRDRPPTYHVGGLAERVRSDSMRDHFRRMMVGR